MAYNRVIPQRFASHDLIGHHSFLFEFPDQFSDFQHEPWGEMDFTTEPTHSTNLLSKLQIPSTFHMDQDTTPGEVKMMTPLSNEYLLSPDEMHNVYTQHEMQNFACKTSSLEHSCMRDISASSRQKSEGDSSSSSTSRRGSSFDASTSTSTSTSNTGSVFSPYTVQHDSYQPSQYASDTQCTTINQMPPSLTFIPMPYEGARPANSSISSPSSNIQNQRSTSIPSSIRPPKSPRRSSRQYPYTTNNIDRNTCPSSDPSRTPDSKLRARQAHSMVERKYRENLNAQISHLHQTLQSAQYGPSKPDSTGTSTDSDPKMANTNAVGTFSRLNGPKFRKIDVLTDALNYVNQTEVEMRHMESEIARLSENVRVLENVVRCEDCTVDKESPPSLARLQSHTPMNATMIAA